MLTIKGRREFLEHPNRLAIPFSIAAPSPVCMDGQQMTRSPLDNSSVISFTTAAS